MDRIFDVITFISKKNILRVPWVAIFADITKILTMFTIYKYLRKVKINRNYVSIREQPRKSPSWIGLK